MDLCLSLGKKEVSVLNHFQILVYYIINCFTLVFNGLGCKLYLKSK